MKIKKQALVVSLLETLAPQLDAVGLTGQKPPKSVLKAVRLLAEQFARLHARHEKRTAKAALLPGQQTRQKLTDELVAVLDAHFAQDVLAAPETALLTETAEELAAKLTKIRARQVKKDRKAAAEPATGLPPVPAAKAVGRQVRAKPQPPVVPAE